LIREWFFLYWLILRIIGPLLYFYITFACLGRAMITADSAITFLKTRDLEATTAWYTRVLGLQLTVDQGTCRIFSVCPGASIGFCLTEGATGSAEVIFTLVVEDVDAACARLEQAGAHIEVRPRINPRFNIYQFFMRDPNGYLIEVQKFL
jgi:catechol 2,3-dioxygenase-like lactoylglutathione lyase family enzyme